MRTRAAVVDASLAVGTLVVIVAAMTAEVGEERPPDVLAYLWAAGLAALMLVRRRHPVLTLVATAVGIVGYHGAGYPAIGVAVPAAGALFSAAEAGRVRAAVLTAAALTAVSTGYRILDGQDLAYLLGFELPLTVSVMGAAIALGDGVASRRLLRAEQAQRLREAEAEHRRELARRVEEERLALARDLHDVVAHTVAVITVQADVAVEACEDDPRQALEAVRTIRKVSAGAMRDLRNTVELLRSPAEDRPRAPVNGLDRLAVLTDAAEAAGLEVSVHVDGDDDVRVPTAVDTTAYRIVQEALTNTIRHARASAADVRISYRPDALDIEVRNDGRPPDDREAAEGHGLRGMAERAGLIGGTIETGPAAGGTGFRVSARLPITAS